MIDFSTVKSIVIPEGEVAAIARGEEILWQKITQKYKVELAYLESTGTQYIDTEVVFDGNTKVCLEAQMTGTSSNSGVLGTVGDGTSDFYISASPSQNKFSSAVGSTTRYNLMFDTEKHYFESCLSSGFCIDDTKTSFGSNSQSYGRCLALFRKNAKVNAYGRIYNCTIYDNNVLVRDFIPVLDWNDVPCMYDKVSGELFYNQGTGEFSYAEA